MLKRLHIENFALVEKLDIDFQDGMSVLTGETGAGKSIIVGAVGRLLGEKADKDDIRSGARLAVIEGDFDVGSSPEIEDALSRLGIAPENSIITLRREIIVDRASRSFVNGRMVTLTQLREITGHLAELFGQHSHQLLLDERNHQSFLDRFAGVGDEVGILKEIYSEWQETRLELARLESRKEIEKNERELLLFQKEEIEKAKITAGEEEELIAEKKILDSSQLLGEKSTDILQRLDRDENAILSALAACSKELTEMIVLDKTLEKKSELLEQSIINLEELRTEIEAYMSSIPDDPDRQEEINLRLDEIYRLKKKYGGSEESILTTLENINVQLGRKIDVGDRIRMLDTQERRFRERYEKLALEISSQRIKASEKLAATVRRELTQVGMDSAKFEYEFIYEDDPEGIKLDQRRVKPGPEGLETGRFLISANPGEPLKPLAKTASGGEISRIMLALKAADKKKSKKYKALLAFDEIDAGIGGKTANMVAERLSRLSRDSQVMVITHLHQIASLSDHHYAVEKVATRSKRKVISIKMLSGRDKKKEIERMLSLPQEVKVSLDSE